MKTTSFGYLADGTEILQYTLRSDSCEVRILTLGGIITDYIFQGRNIVCGFDTLEDYLTDTTYQGALVGRYANRIAAARFDLNGKTYHVTANEGENSLHGGALGFSRRVFDVVRAKDTELCLSLFSPDGEEGYPGNLSLRVTYTLDGASLSIRYVATTDADTPLSLTNHAYFNLGGVGTPVLDCRATVLADRYTAVDNALIPTGERPLVEGTEFDLRSGRRIGDKPSGFDNNFILKKIAEDHTPSLAAIVENEELSLTLYTTQPCLQLYTACAMEGGPAFRGGVPKKKHTAFCLESQSEPNGPNRGEGILRAGETYDHTTVYHLERK
ncbi:MAG: galactose mutarotase [Clostridia bacterium]|nr:galactose mutarotase [Clostridia bacterium]